MALTTNLSRYIPNNIEQRGRSLLADGAVRIHEGDKALVEATVLAGGDHEVSLFRGGRTVSVWCTCPYFQERETTCEHVWATLLVAEAQGYLQRSNGKDPLYLEAEPPDDYEDDEYLDSDEPEYWDDGPDDWDEPTAPFYAPPVQPLHAPRARKKATRARSWKEQLAGLRRTPETEYAPRRESWPAGREILYVVDREGTMDGAGLVLEVAYRQPKRDGSWSKLKSQRIPLAGVPELPDPADRQALALLTGARDSAGPGYAYYSYYDSAPCRYTLSAPQQEALLPLLCRTGRCRLRRSADDEELTVLRWDDGEPWEFWLKVRPEDSGKHYVLAGGLRRGEERMPLEAPIMLLAGGLIFWEDRVARLRDFEAFPWIGLLRAQRELRVPVKQKEELLKELFQQPHLPRLDLPDELRVEQVAPVPRPRLKVRPPTKRGFGYYGRDDWLRGELSFDYDGVVVPSEPPGSTTYQAEQRRLIVRDAAAERGAEARLRQLGFSEPSYGPRDQGLQLAPRNLPRVVRELLAEGWHVEAEGKVYRKPGEFRIEVTSGIDWFELHGAVSFGDRTAPLPDLLAALRKGENTVRLDDGTFGILPEDWLKKYGLLAGLGKSEDDHVRFGKTQVGLLDALLAAQPEATCDAVFAQAREELRRFEGIEPADAPAGFVGQLRGYQREGLGWLHFLRRFGFGGCLADDMGLGKTVQVLALLESRRELRAQGGKKRPGPSLVVVPKSLVFNWKQEAARFTPALRVYDHTGVNRARPGEHFDDYDVVLTTYGTLRRDAADFKDVRFDYCILDEAQAIKNADSVSAKAARLLQADHRLALSGTPVENHLGELWSLFEFLNPGMLGAASVFKLNGTGARNPDPEVRSLLARALRPFILRRTKEQVARDLPLKTEQTLYCELEPAQRRHYDQLREHYRQALLGRVERDGLNKVKMQVLEALLRLRQAACHPGLIDKAKAGESSAKLDLLVPQLAEVIDEGHKVLVFSQFTSFLSILRDRLDREGIRYEYLDGRTRNRAEKVERFQGDPECRLFLISLKAGGLGLNLTAAEYVFLLDPWWNPAVEAQAIDRTHRIGQTRPVFAYRVIARDTVEEKVLELQKTKRDLADAILSADNSLIRDLSREDLQLLLS